MTTFVLEPAGSLESFNHNALMSHTNAEKCTQPIE